MNDWLPGAENGCRIGSDQSSPYGIHSTFLMIICGIMTLNTVYTFDLQIYIFSSSLPSNSRLEYLIASPSSPLRCLTDITNLMCFSLPPKPAPSALFLILISGKSFQFFEPKTLESPLSSPFHIHI